MTHIPREQDHQEVEIDPKILEVFHSLGFTSEQGRRAFAQQFNISDVEFESPSSAFVVTQHTNPESHGKLE